MHRTQILRTLIGTGLLLISVTSGAVTKASKVDVYSEFQKKIASLETSLQKEKDATKRYDLFLKEFRALSDLRAKNPRQAEEKELNMSLYMDTLAFLPEKKDFSVKKCPEYKKEVNNLMKSYDKSQKEVFVEKALKLVDLICP